MVSMAGFALRWLWECFPELCCWLRCRVIHTLSPHNNLRGSPSTLVRSPVPTFILYLILMILGISSKPLWTFCCSCLRKILGFPWHLSPLG